MNEPAADIESAYSSLSPEHQRVLACVAPFTAAVHPATLRGYPFKLRRQPLLAEFPWNQWPDAIREAKARGLFRPHPAERNYLSIPSAWTAILRGRPEFAPQAPTRRAIETAFREINAEYADAILKLLLSTLPNQRQFGQDLTHVEYQNFLAAMDVALEHGKSFNRYFACLTQYLKATGHYERGLEVSQRVRARLEDPREKLTGRGRLEHAVVVARIAEFEHWLRRYEAAEAHYMQAVGIFSEVEGQPTEKIQAGLAMTYHDLGLLAYEQRKWAEAGGYLRKALTFWEVSKHPSLHAETLCRLGGVMARQSDNEGAEECYRKAREMYVASGDRLAQAKVLADWAGLDGQRGRLQEAKQHYRSALAVFNEFGDREHAGVVYRNLACIEDNEGDWRKAWKHYQKARRLAFEVGDVHGQAETCVRLAAIALARDESETARRYLRRALKHSRADNDRPTQALVLHSLGRIEKRRRRWKRAGRYYHQAIAILNGLNDVQWTATVNMDLGLLAYRGGEWKNAQTLLLDALSMFVRCNDRRGSIRAIMRLAGVWDKTSDTEFLRAVAETIHAPAEEVQRIFNTILGRQ